MTIETYGQWMGRPMDGDDIASLLESAGWGILSLADGDVPYSLPISFGYDDGTVYFAFIRDSPSGTKFEFIADGVTARLLATNVRSRFDWQSVAVTGTVRAVEPDGDGWDALLEALDGNAWFSTDFERAAGVQELLGWRIDPDEVEGLEVRPDRG